MKSPRALANLVLVNLGLSGSLFLLTGCITAKPARATSMVPVDIQVSRHHPVSVMLQVEGGAETDAMLMPQISSAAFRDALVTAIINSALFAAIREQPPADYRLNVSIVKCTQKSFTTHVTMMSRWQLTRLSDNQQIFEEFIESNGKGKLSEAMAGMERLRVGYEKAGRENVRLGLIKLSQLDLR